MLCKGCWHMNAREFFEKKMPKMIQMLEKRLPATVTFAFILDGNDGGQWQVQREGPSFSVGPVDNQPKDCELRCTSDVFLDIISGALNPRRAWLDGRLQLQGDIGLALCLQDLLAA